MSNYSITPQGSIYLCNNLPLKPNYTDVWSFASVTERLNYFKSHVAYTFTDYTYIKKDENIVVGENVDNLRKCNYLFYNSYSNNNPLTAKTYFCFITDMEYINENATRIYFTTDVWTTYCFDIAGNKCFIEREHVNKDEIGENILDEGLNVGEYQQEKQDFLLPATSLAHILIIVQSNYTPVSKSNVATETDKSNRANHFAGVTLSQGAMNGFQLVAFPIRTQNNDTIAEGLEHLIAFIHRASTDGYIEDIHAMYVVPYDSITNITFIAFYDSAIGSKEYNYGLIPNTTYGSKIWSINFDMKVDFSYRPKNNKCYCYPFNYVQVSDMQGNTADYKFENFDKKTTASFRANFIGTAISGSGILLPVNYKNIDADYEDGLPFPKYPVCGWSSDAYTNWLTKEGVSQEISFLGDLTTGMLGSGIELMATSGIPTGNFSYQPKHMKEYGKHFYDTTPDISTLTQYGEKQTSMMTSKLNATSLLGQMINIIDSNRRAQMLPSIQGGKSTADIMNSLQMLGFSFRQMRAKDEYLKAIDKFFTMFGYKVNITESPVIYYRKSFDYKKTMNCNFTGNIPNDDLNTLNQAFNNGIRIWHYRQDLNMFDFDVDNSINV